MKAYIQYPNPHFSLHWNDRRFHVQNHHVRGERFVQINSSTFEGALSRFIARQSTFAPSPEQDDMWPGFSLGSPRLEEGVVLVIQAVFGNRYARFATASVQSDGCLPTASDAGA